MNPDIITSATDPTAAESTILFLSRLAAERDEDRARFYRSLQFARGQLDEIATLAQALDNESAVDAVRRGLGESLPELQKTCNGQWNVIAERDATIASLRADLDAANARLASQDAKGWERLARQVTAAESRAAELKRERDEAVELASRQYTIGRANALDGVHRETEWATVRAAINRLAAATDDSERADRICDLRIEVEAYASTGRARETAATIAAGKEIERLTARIASLEAESARATAQIGAMNRDLEARADEVAALTARLASLTAPTDASDEEMARELQTYLRGLDDEWMSWQAMDARTQAEMIAAIASVIRPRLIDGAKVRIGDLETRATAAESRVAELERDLADLYAANARLAAAVAGSAVVSKEAAARTAERDSARAEVASLKADRDLLQRKADAARLSCENTEGALKLARSEHAAVIDRLAEARADAKTARDGRDAFVDAVVAELGAEGSTADVLASIRALLADRAKIRADRDEWRAKAEAASLAVSGERGAWQAATCFVSAESFLAHRHAQERAAEAQRKAQPGAVAAGPVWTGFDDDGWQRAVMGKLELQVQRRIPAPDGRPADGQMPRGNVVIESNAPQTNWRGRLLIAESFWNTEEECRAYCVRVAAEINGATVAPVSGEPVAWGAVSEGSGRVFKADTDRSEVAAACDEGDLIVPLYRATSQPAGEASDEELVAVLRDADLTQPGQVRLRAVYNLGRGQASQVARFDFPALAWTTEDDGDLESTTRTNDRSINAMVSTDGRWSVSFRGRAASMDEGQSDVGRIHALVTGRATAKAAPVDAAPANSIDEVDLLCPCGHRAGAHSCQPPGRCLVCGCGCKEDRAKPAPVAKASDSLGPCGDCAVEYGCFDGSRPCSKAAAPVVEVAPTERYVVVERDEVKGRPALSYPSKRAAQLAAAAYNDGSACVVFTSDARGLHPTWSHAIVDTAPKPAGGDAPKPTESPSIDPAALAEAIEASLTMRTASGAEWASESRVSWSSLSETGRRRVVDAALATVGAVAPRVLTRSDVTCAVLSFPRALTAPDALDAHVWSKLTASGPVALPAVDVEALRWAREELAGDVMEAAPRKRALAALDAILAANGPVTP